MTLGRRRTTLNFNYFRDIALSNNDPSNEFGLRLASIIDMNEAIGAQSLFVLEANTIEKNKRGLARKHATMVEVATHRNIPWIDLHGHLQKPKLYDSGIIWWDGVHMTSYGQALAGAYIADGIIANLENRGLD
jgi:lysophospholipase L1-like esterase